jgi:beta-galactosidase beta subunit
LMPITALFQQKTMIVKAHYFALFYRNNPHNPCGNKLSML